MQTETTQWKPSGARLMTEWGERLDPGQAWREYPRPQLVREPWQNLNGLWDHAIRSRTAPAPAQYDGPILVPFCPESALSGVGRRVSPDERLWYRRIFSIPEAWEGQATLLHFGAVDFECTVWINGGLVGHHRGGSIPFFFDITDFLGPGEQEIVVSVWDPTNTDDQPRGKQDLSPHAIWYTPVTGIWQTVWLEPVARENSIEELRTTPFLDQGRIRLQAIGRVPSRTHRDRVRVSAFDQGRCVARAEGDIDESIDLKLPDPKPWSPEHPFLYGLAVELLSKGRRIDAVDSYFALRKIALEPAESGARILLNNEPVFQYGALDQGWWPDGLLTPPSPEALRHDVDFLKAAGFNMLRKHVKVEPQIFYAYCDRVGLLVWQDMPSAGVLDSAFDPAARCTVQHVEPGGCGDVLMRSRSALQFDYELRGMMAALYNHPCIVAWVPLNEGWGQHETRHKTQLLRSIDPSRLVDSTSGWEDRRCGDLFDIHSYDKETVLPEPCRYRAAVLGEFGGLGHPVAGHLWCEKSWGYQNHESVVDLADQYVRQVARIAHGIRRKGLQAAVYTQVSDVESEVNGLQTYDRKVAKLDPAWLRSLHASLFSMLRNGGQNAGCERRQDEETLVEETP